MNQEFCWKQDCLRAQSADPTIPSFRQSELCLPNVAWTFQNMPVISYFQKECMKTRLLDVQYSDYIQNAFLIRNKRFLGEK